MAFGTPVAEPEAKPEALPQKDRLDVFNCPCMKPCLLRGKGLSKWNSTISTAFYCGNKCKEAGKC